MNFFLYGILLISCLNICQVKAATGTNDNFKIQPRSYGDDVSNILEEFRNRFCYAIPKFGLPKLDPFGVVNHEIQIKEGPVDLDISLNELTAAGLGLYEINKLKISGTLIIQFEGILPEIHLKTKYKVKGSIKDLFDINGDGDLNVTLCNIKLTLDAKIRKKPELVQPLALLIDDLSASFDSINFRIDGLFPGQDQNDFVSELITDLGVELFNDFWEENKESVKLKIAQLADKKLENLTIQDVIGMIGSLGKLFDDDDPVPDCKYIKNPEACNKLP